MACLYTHKCMDSLVETMNVQHIIWCRKEDTRQKTPMKSGGGAIKAESRLFLLSVDRMIVPRAKEKRQMRSRQKLINTTLPALLCVMALVLAACGGSTNTPASTTKAASSKQVFVLPEAGVPDIATFDPGLSTDAPSLAAIDMVFTGLVQLDDNGNVKGYLASSWDVSADHVTYTFHLRPNLKFSDGTPLTSADVAYSIDRALQP